MKRFIAGLLCFVLMISNIGPSIVNATEIPENEITEISESSDIELPGLSGSEVQELVDEDNNEAAGSENTEFIETTANMKAIIESDSFSYDEFINAIHATGYFYNILKRLGEETRLCLYEKLSINECYSLWHLSKYEYLNELVYSTEITSEVIDEYFSYIEIYSEMLEQLEIKTIESEEISVETRTVLEQYNYEILTSFLSEQGEQYQNHDSYLAFLNSLSSLDLSTVYEEIQLLDAETEESLIESLNSFKGFLYETYGFDVEEDVEIESPEIPESDLEESEDMEETPEVDENDSTDVPDLENKEESIETEKAEENQEESFENQEFIIGFEDYDWNTKTAYMTLNVDEEERKTIESLLPETIDIILESQTSDTPDSESLLPKLESGEVSLGIDLPESSDETLHSSDLLNKNKIVTLPVSWVTDKNIEDPNEKDFVYHIQLELEEYDFNDTIKEKLTNGEYTLPFIEVHITDKTEIVDFVDFNEEGYDPYTTITFSNEERSIVNDYLAEHHTTINAKLGDGSIQEIPAAWVCDSDIVETMFGLYTYRLVIPEGYHLSAEMQEKYDNYDIMLPFIDVNISADDRFNRASLTRYTLMRDGSSPNYIFLFAYISSPSGTQKVYAGPNGSVSLNNMTATSKTIDGLTYNYMYAIPIVSGKYGLYCFNISLNGSTNAGRVNFIAGNAMIGSTFYNTMADAVSSASSGATIELLRADCREYDYSYLANKTVTIRPSSSNTVTTEGYTVTVRNSREAVTVNLPTKDGQTFFVRNHTGNLTLSGYGSYSLNFNGANLSDPNTNQEDPVYSAIFTLASSASSATTSVKSGVNIYNVGKGTGDGYGLGHGDANIHDANITINIESGVNIYNNSTGVGGSGSTKITGGNFYNNDKDGVLVLADNASTSAAISGGNYYNNGARGIAFGGLETISTSGRTHVGDISGATVYGNGTHGVYINTSTTEKWDVSVSSSTIRNNSVEGFYVYNGIGRFVSGNIYSNSDDGIGVYSASSVCYMSGGSVYSNGTTGSAGGGVWIKYGTFNMSGGSVYSNTASNGGGVYNEGTFNLSGGSVYSNTASSYGKGVYQGGTMTMKGSGVVNADNDVYLPSGKYITVNGALTGTATITPDSYWCFRTCVVDNYSGIGSTYLSNFTLTPKSPYLFAAGDKLKSNAGVTDEKIVIIRTHTISYDSNGGSAVSDQTYDLTTDITLSEAPSREGYIFKGWRLDTSVNNWNADIYPASQNIGTGKYGDIILVAEWKLVERDVYVTGRINASDYHSEHGNPTLFFRMEGTDVEGNPHTYYRCVTFTSSVVSGKNGLVSLTVTFKNVPAGEYTVIQEDMSRFEVTDVQNIENCTISGKKAIYDLVAHETAHAVFVDKKYEWQGFSDAVR